MSGQIIFIVWRESVEALLIIGILYVWLSKNAAGTSAWRYLWSGVFAGVALALALAYAIFQLSGWLPPDALDYFLVTMMIIAVGLIIQMIYWMRAHGRTLKSEMEQGLSHAANGHQWWGVFALAMLAVAREGSETVVFLYGILSGNSLAGPAVYGSIFLGFGVAFLTYLALQLGGRFISWRIFFRVTEIMLLLLGCALIVSAADKLIALGVLPFSSIVWNTSFLLDDGTRFGGAISALTGYRARPDWVLLTVWVLYWVGVFALLKLQSGTQSRQVKTT